jgi:hypothetical protein
MKRLLNMISLDIGKLPKSSSLELYFWVKGPDVARILSFRIATRLAGFVHSTLRMSLARITLRNADRIKVENVLVTFGEPK